MPKSILTFIVRRETFPNEEDADHATTSMIDAAKGWNKLRGEVPQFKRVFGESDVVFQIVYKDKVDGQHRTLARSFFPGSKDCTIYVTAKAFENPFRLSLVYIFNHELGHVLGLRHEFAPEEEKEYPSVILGDRNDDSVMNDMNHFTDPSQIKIHDLDLQYMSELYKFENHQVYNRLRIEDKVP